MCQDPSFPIKIDNIPSINKQSLILEITPIARTRVCEKMWESIFVVL